MVGGKEDEWSVQRNSSQSDKTASEKLRMKHQYILKENSTRDADLLFVTSGQTKEKSKSIEIVLKKVHWQPGA